MQFLCVHADKQSFFFFNLRGKTCDTESYFCQEIPRGSSKVAVKRVITPAKITPATERGTEK